jgi:deferrochelatase/peroxidase EfeB
MQLSTCCIATKQYVVAVAQESRWYWQIHGSFQARQKSTHQLKALITT